MNHICSLLFIVLFLACTDQKSSSMKDEIISSQTEKIKELENQVKASENNNKKDNFDYLDTLLKGHFPKDFFYLGSTESEVVRVQGVPTSLDNIDNNKVFRYGSSEVRFSGGKVISYSNTDNNLRIKVTPESLEIANTKILRPKMPTKYVYFWYMSKHPDFPDLPQLNYSKIYKITEFNQDKLYEIKNCLVDHIKSFGRQSGLVNMSEYIFDSYTTASADWNNVSGQRINVEALCGLEIRISSDD